MPVVLTPEELTAALEGMQPLLVKEIRKRSRSLALQMEKRGKTNATTRLRVRTGTLRRSVAGVVETGSNGALQVGVSAGGRLKGKPVPYARLQDLGGVVRPKRAKWLAIPHDSVRTGAGVARYPSPRNYPRPLRFVLSKRPGLAMLVEDTQQGPQVRWWLRKQTKIPASYFLRDAFRETVRETPSTLLGAFEAVMPGAGRGA